MGTILPTVEVVVVSKVSGGAMVRGMTLVDVAGGIVGVVVDVCGGVVACGLGDRVVRVVVTSGCVVDTYGRVVVGIVSDTGSVGIGSDTGRVVDASVVVVCRVVGVCVVVGRSLDEGTGSVVEGTTF